MVSSFGHLAYRPDRLWLNTIYSLYGQIEKGACACLYLALIVVPRLIIAGTFNAYLLRTGISIHVTWHVPGRCRSWLSPLFDNDQSLSTGIPFWYIISQVFQVETLWALIIVEDLPPTTYREVARICQRGTWPCQPVGCLGYSACL